MAKYVRLMADYCSSGVWDENGTNIDINDLPIHYWLKSMITEWQAEYDRVSLEEDLFDVQLFAKNGYALAFKLKQNLPDWTVMYFDESKAFQNLPRSEFLKEIVI